MEKALGHPSSWEDACGGLVEEREVKWPEGFLKGFQDVFLQQPFINPPA